jgi:two-component system, LytTR family, sensor kinase
MKWALPKYTSKDYVVMMFVLLPFSLLCNSIAMGYYYFSNYKVFIVATLATAITFAIFFTVCGGVAVLLKNRFPRERQVVRRLSFMIITFLIMSGLFLLLLYRMLPSLPYISYKVEDDDFVWTYFALGICNIFLTFLLEGIARYERWKTNQQETEQLRKIYRQGRAQGLKSQVNPHFLFNSLNSLSSLISEDEAAAEKFLDEMSKVYRYMLRNEDDQVVTLDTELKFLQSYVYLLKARYGDGLQVTIQVTAPGEAWGVPPMALQTIIENAITHNAISKRSPLQIAINTPGHAQIKIVNTLQPKKITDILDTESGLDNLLSKYELLTHEKVKIIEYANAREIILPLVNKQKEGVII